MSQIIFYNFERHPTHEDLQNIYLLFRKIPGNFEFIGFNLV